MGNVDSLRHGLHITGDGGGKKVLRGSNRLHKSSPGSVLHRIQKFFTHLLVRDVALFHILIVCQITKMYQHCEYITLAVDDAHVILELKCIYIHMFS